MAALVDAPRFGSRRVLVIGALLAVVGLGLTGVSIAIDPRRALFGYLAAYAIAVSIPAGALILLQIGHAANTRWLSPLRRHLESITIVFPVLVVLFVPIALGLGLLYIWVDPPATLAVHDRAVIAAKGAWLSPAAFVIRGFVYLGVLTLTAELLRRWSRRRDQGPPPLGDAEALVRRERVFASAMLPPVGLAVTFASFDWLMSLDPTWLSSMFGVYYFAGGFVAAIALLAILARRAPATTPHHFHALGRMLLAFVVFWVYTAYFQGFLIQIANKPNEVTFFITRTRDGWYGVLWAMLIVQFVVPFFLLLPRAPKFRASYVAAIAGAVLVGHILDIYWIVLPVAGPLAPALADVAALVGIVGACMAFAAWRQAGVPAVPIGDPFLEPGRHYESPT